MVERVERLKANDFEELLDFLNLVFSQAYSPHDFLTFLPRLFAPTDASMQNHFVVKKNGRIRAVVGLYPMTLLVGSTPLKVAGIGSVSTHPNERNNGLMRQLMEASLEEMRLEGYHLSWLRGARQRYQHYGYERAGMMFNFSLDPKNAQSFLAQDNSQKVIKFAPITENSQDWLHLAKQLHDSQPIKCDRPAAGFYQYLKSCRMYPWVALDAAGNMLGYLVTNQEQNRVTELQTVNTVDCTRIVSQWVTKEAKDSISLILPPWAKEYIQAFGAVSEYFSLSVSGNWRIFDWVQVISSLMHSKAGWGQLLDGTVNFQIENYGTVKIQVENGNILCSRVEEKPDFYCDEFLAIRLILGPYSPENVTGVPTQLLPLLNSWFPLPLTLPEQDSV